jgi:hypothetical protein
MNEERYDLVFSGELVPGFELPQVKKNLQQLFRLDEAKVNALFSGKAIPLKKGVDADAANKYRVAMKKAGARVDLVLVSEAASAAPVKPQSPPPPQPQPVAPVAPAAKESGLTTVLGAQPLPPKTARPSIEAPNFGLSAPGAELLRPDERVEAEPVSVDISHLSVAPQEGNLVKEDEFEILPGIAVTVPDLDVAAVGADLLKPDERENVQPLELDLSHLTLGRVGERLGPAAPPAPPPPNVDHLKLKT